MLTLPVYNVLPAGPQGLQSRFAVRETTQLSPPKPGLLDRVRTAPRARHSRRRTEDAYVVWIKRYIFFFHAKRHPAERWVPMMPPASFSSLAVDGQVAASTLNQALSALLFLYRDVLEVDLPWLDGVVRAERPQRLPVVLTRDEVQAVLQRLEGVPRLMAGLLYGTGLRVLDCCRLRAQDVDFAANQIVVRGGKGDKGPRHDAAGRGQGRSGPAPRDGPSPASRRPCRRRGLGRAADRAAEKYPNAGREWAWPRVSPATRIHRDRVTGHRRRPPPARDDPAARGEGRRPAGQSLPSAPVPTGSGTRSRRTSLRRGTTSGPLRSCWGIGT
jgi:Phage integrase, N-terminal SAM-like domain/Phage integrase family